MSTKEHVIVTSIGSDRPGIVAELSRWILENGGNIEDSRMSQLGGEFATLVLVSGEIGVAQKLESTREQHMQRCGQNVFTKTVAATPAPPAVSHLRYELKATALDHPGIVHQVSELLRQQAVNIVSASTHTSAAPFTGAPVFQFQMTVDVPGTIAVSRLREELRQLGDRDNIDLVLTAAE
jgi:glycine cleavage system transcriptional repressor